jgi:DNA-binding NarL/FixJ family response regulator
MREGRSLSGARILIVEDNFVVADALRFRLDSHGGRVRATAPNLERAFRALQEHDVDIAVLDIDLNGTSVVAFAEHLGSEGVPFVFLSGYGDDQLLPEPLRARPRFDKPVRDDQLVQKMMELLGRVSKDPPAVDRNRNEGSQE